MSNRILRESADPQERTDYQVIRETEKDLPPNPASDEREPIALSAEAPDWAVARVRQLREGGVVERLGKNGVETWRIEGVERGGRVYLVADAENMRPRHAVLHAVEVVLEERAASFGPTLAKHWPNTLRVVASQSTHPARTAEVLAQNASDILSAAAERMVVDPDGDPAATLYRIARDVPTSLKREERVKEADNHERIQKQAAAVLSDVTGHLNPKNSAETKFAVRHQLRIRDRIAQLLKEERGISTKEAAARVLEDVWREAGADPAVKGYIERVINDFTALVNAQSLLGHLRYGSAQEAHGPADDADASPMALEDLTDMSPVLPVARIAAARSDAAHVLIGAPELRAQILDNLIPVDVSNPRALAVIDHDLDAVDREIAALDHAWKLQGKGDKRDPAVVTHFAKVYALRQHEKALMAERRAALHRDEQRVTHVLTTINNRWATSAPTAAFLRGQLARGANPLGVAKVLELYLAENALPPVDRRSCMLLYGSLKKDYFAEVTPPPDAIPRTAPETVIVEDDEHDESAIAPMRIARPKPAVIRDAPRMLVPAPARSPNRRAPHTQNPRNGERAQADAAPAYTESLRTFAAPYGGPEKFLRLHHHLRSTLPNIVTFTIAQLENAGPLLRWWYQRQMKKGVEARATRRRRGHLQA